MVGAPSLHCAAWHLQWWVLPHCMVGIESDVDTACVYCNVYDCRLHVVDLSKNGLTSIPPPYAWKSLGMREMRYTGNKINKIDLADGKRFWSHLESFYIGQNKLKEVNMDIGQPSLIQVV